MDKIDATILNILQQNARTPNTEIAKQLGMVPSAILERIRKLEKRGVIQKYRATLNPAAIDLHLLAFVIIESKYTNWSDEGGKRLAAIPNIEDVYEVLGEDSYFVKIRARNMDELSDLLKNDL